MRLDIDDQQQPKGPPMSDHDDKTRAADAWFSENFPGVPPTERKPTPEEESIARLAAGADKPIANLADIDPGEAEILRYVVPGFDEKRQAALDERAKADRDAAPLTAAEESDARAFEALIGPHALTPRERDGLAKRDNELQAAEERAGEAVRDSQLNGASRREDDSWNERHSHAIARGEVAMRGSVAAFSNPDVGKFDR
jgi:hypothetical protein